MSSETKCCTGLVGRLNFSSLCEGAEAEERGRKQDKLAAFSGQCNEVYAGLYVAGQEVARDKTLLQHNNVTHIVNCVGELVPDSYPADFHYLTFNFSGAFKLYLREALRKNTKVGYLFMHRVV